MILQEIWEKSLSRIEEKTGANIFELWIKPIKPVQLKDQQLTLEVPNRFFKEWIEDYYPTLINEVMEGLLGYAVTLKYRIAEKQAVEIKRIEAKLENRKTRLASRGIYLNPKYTFENFISGQSNQLRGPRQRQWRKHRAKFITRCSFTAVWAWGRRILSAQ